MNIVLCGFMGSGKSTIGKILSQKTGKEFIDLDSYIENEKKLSINQIFNKFGESEFRKFETQAIKEIVKKDNCIISLGGGSVIKQENIVYLKSNGKIVFLEVSPQTVYERTKNDTKRPLLQVENPLQKIIEMLNLRMPFYIKAADFRINVEKKQVNEIADEILKII